MTDKSGIPVLEFHGPGEEVPRHLRAALALPLFRKCTLDYFYDDEHYRVESCYAFLDLHGLTFNQKYPLRVLKRTGTQWVVTTKRTFPIVFPAISPKQILHGLNGRVILMYFTHGKYDGKEVRIVLYPTDRPPTLHSKILVGWTSEGAPVYNGSYDPYVIS